MFRTNVRPTMRTFVALDLETTGLDPVADRVTEVAAVRFDEDGAIAARFSTLVNPGREIPYFIEQLTGVTNDAVRGAPSLPQVAAELRAFLGEGPVVGQNVGFDLGCLRREGVAIDLPAIDTAALSRLLLPGRQSRGLMDLAASLDVEAGEHHRALPDAETAARIFVALLRRAAEIPAASRLQLARLVSMHDLAMAEAIAGGGPEGGEPAPRVGPALRPPASWTPLTKREPREEVPAELLRRVLATGPAAMPGFEERPEQATMAETVRRSLAEGGHWLMEAGTGVGKSLAYLLPAALHALRNGERVVVSTNTINLQEQLLAKDIPALRRMLLAAGVIEREDDLRAAVLKGRANYLCLQRWMASFGANLGDPDFARLAAAMVLWLPETETGDRSELNLDGTDWLTWQRFSAQDTDCLQRQARPVREGNCFLLRARRAAESAHIVVVNHALLLADVASNGSALPGYDHLVVDEAHNLEEQATQQFGGSVSRRQFLEALDGLHRRPGRGLREGGVVALLKAFPEGGLPMAGKALENAVARVASPLALAFEELGRQAPARGEDDRLLVTRATRAQPAWTAVEQAWDALDRALRQVKEKADAASRLIVAAAMVEEPDALAGEIDSAARRVEDLRILHAALMSATGDDLIVWVARERDGAGTLNSAPLEVGPTLWERLFSKKRTVVATSATLAAAGSMDFAAERLGIEDPQTLQLGSPFDYEASTLLASFTGIPEPAEAGYTQAVGEAVAELVLASGGRALALFTSHRALRDVAALVRPDLEPAGIVVLAQGVDGTPRQLVERLVANPRTLILGTSSFWEGVDVKGEALSMLIIARLPFAVPTDPVYRVRSEQYANPFMEFALPAAILRFRQGFGRLIRSREDRGVVAVLDPRVYQKRYGVEFEAALPRCTYVRGDVVTVAARARRWLTR